jgi:adenylate kinase
MKVRSQAILLIGPTGTGKTPLGECMEERGIFGSRAVHFDFGEHLRRAAASPEDYPLLSSDDIGIVATSLETGALLTDEQFPIAKRLLRSFAEARRLAPTDWLVLNGLPRDVDQARKIDDIVEISTLVVLECDAGVVMERIATNAGGDRTHRVDDDVKAVENKLAIFEACTRPLVDYYMMKNIIIKRVAVSLESDPGTILDRISRPN